MICEFHFPGDVAAGQSYGMLIAERLMEQPAFQAQFNAAAAEVKAAGLS
ncbi:hypothetical protein [Sphingomonas oligoaromativorans]|nr:hypothetical protein [Sphingomonas oligoaromativorans]NIJ34966.1 membrane-associated phospholipid phosphatase [Sphingomonas oligoaromativorans]